MKRTILIGALVALTLVPAMAEDASSDFTALAGDATATEAPAQLGTLKWSGDQEFAWRFGAADNPTRTGGLVDGTLAGEYKLGDLKVVGAASARNNEFVPGETAAFYTLGPVKVGVGLQEFSWGLADKKNPTDTLNARDYRYGADAPRLVNPAATLAVYPADWVSLEAVYEPWKEASKFPKDFKAVTQAGLTGSATVLKAGIKAKADYYSALGTAGAVAAAQYNGLYSLLSATYNPTATAEGSSANTYDKPVYGGRANFFLPGVDLSLSYVYDRDTYYTPTVTMKNYAGAMWLPETVDLTLKRIHRVGLNAKTTVDRFGLWVESAYNVTEDHAGTDDGLRNDKVSWTTGVDFNFGPSSAYYANVQYAGEWVLGYDAATASDYTTDPTATQLADKAYMTRRTYRSLVQSLGSETEEIMNTVTASVKFPMADNLVTPSLSCAVIVPTNYDKTDATTLASKERIASAFFKPEVDVMPADGVHVLVGADLAYGWVKKAGSSDIVQDTTTDKLGVYTPQNNLYVKVQYKWNGSLGN